MKNIRYAERRTTKHQTRTTKLNTNNANTTTNTQTQTQTTLNYSLICMHSKHSMCWRSRKVSQQSIWEHTTYTKSALLCALCAIISVPNEKKKKIISLCTVNGSCEIHCGPKGKAAAKHKLSRRLCTHQTKHEHQICSALAKHQYQPTNQMIT